jgi:hypothetical protein
MGQVNDTRVDLLHEMLLAPLQTTPEEVATAAAKMTNSDAAWNHERAKDAFFRHGAWAGYKLAFAVFEFWLGMTSNTCQPQRFAVHSNPSNDLPDGAMRVGEPHADTQGIHYGECEDGGSCRG